MKPDAATAALPDNGFDPERRMALRRPYLLFLADVETEPFAKTAFGIRDWAPESSLAQLRLPGCGVEIGRAHV
mgnify:CR=1 FL=1